MHDGRKNKEFEKSRRRDGHRLSWRFLQVRDKAAVDHVFLFPGAHAGMAAARFRFARWRPLPALLGPRITKVVAEHQSHLRAKRKFTTRCS